MASRIVLSVLVVICAMTTVTSKSVSGLQGDMANADAAQGSFAPGKTIYYATRDKRDVPLEQIGLIGASNNDQEVMDVAETHIFRPMFRNKGFKERRNRHKRDASLNSNPQTGGSHDQESFEVAEIHIFRPLFRNKGFKERKNRPKRDASLNSNAQIGESDDQEMFDVAETHIFRPMFRNKGFKERRNRPKRDTSKKPSDDQEAMDVAETKQHRNTS